MTALHDASEVKSDPPFYLRTLQVAEGAYRAKPPTPEAEAHM